MSYAKRLAPIWLCLLMVIARPVVADEPATIRAGVFITDIYNINFAQSQFSAQFWVWFSHSRESFQPESSIELPHARTFRILTAIREDRNGVFWGQAKYEATLNQSWNIVYYPFDRQVLRVFLEMADADARQVQLVADEAGSRVSQELELDGWRIDGFRILGGDQTYQTAYGDPALDPNGPSTYSRITVELELKRDGLRLLLSDFIGFFFAIALSGIVLVINANKKIADRVPLSNYGGCQTTRQTGFSRTFGAHGWRVQVQ